MTTTEGFSQYLLQRICDGGREWLISVVEEKEEFLDENSIRALRRLAWAHLLGVASGDHLEDWCNALDENRKDYAKMLFEVATERSPSILDFLWNNAGDAKWLLKQTISNDVNTLKMESPIFAYAVNKAMLVRFVFAWCYTHNYSEDQSIMYQQGMCDLAAIVLTIVVDGEYVGGDQEQDSPGVALSGKVFNEHDAYGLFKGLMDSGMKTVFLASCGKQLKNDETTAPIFARCSAIHDVLLRRCDDQVYSHLQSVGIEPQFYLLRWLRCLFTREFPLHEILVIWDAIFTNGYRSAERRRKRNIETGGWMFGTCDDRLQMSCSELLIQEMYADLDKPAEMLAAAAASSSALPMVDFMAVALVRSSRRRLLKCGRAGCLEILAGGDCKPQISALLRETRRSMEANLPRVDDAPLSSPRFDVVTPRSDVVTPRIKSAPTDGIMNTTTLLDTTVRQCDVKSVKVQLANVDKQRADVGDRLDSEVAASHQASLTTYHEASNAFSLKTVVENADVPADVHKDNEGVKRSERKPRVDSPAQRLTKSSLKSTIEPLASNVQRRTTVAGKDDCSDPATIVRSLASHHSSPEVVRRGHSCDSHVSNGTKISVVTSVSMKSGESDKSQDAFYCQLGKLVKEQYDKNMGFISDVTSVASMDSQELFYSQLGKTVQERYDKNMGFDKSPMSRQSNSSSFISHYSAVFTQTQVGCMEQSQTLSHVGSYVARIDCTAKDEVDNTTRTAGSLQSDKIIQSDKIMQSDMTETDPSLVGSTVGRLDCNDAIGVDKMAHSSGRVSDMESLRTVKSFYSDYGDVPQAGGCGPDPAILQERGNEYIRTEFPLCDSITSAGRIEDRQESPVHVETMYPSFADLSVAPTAMHPSFADLSVAPTHDEVGGDAVDASVPNPSDVTTVNHVDTHSTSQSGFVTAKVSTSPQRPRVVGRRSSRTNLPSLDQIYEKAVDALAFDMGTSKQVVHAVDERSTNQVVVNEVRVGFNKADAQIMRSSQTMETVDRRSTSPPSQFVSNLPVDHATDRLVENVQRNMTSPGRIALNAVESVERHQSGYVALHGQEVRLPSPLPMNLPGQLITHQDGRARSADIPLRCRQRSPNRAPISIPHRQFRSSSPVQIEKRQGGGQRSLASIAREKCHSTVPNELSATPRRSNGLIPRRPAPAVDMSNVVVEAQRSLERAVSSKARGVVSIENASVDQDPHRLQYVISPEAARRLASPTAIGELRRRSPSPEMIAATRDELTERLRNSPLGRTPHQRGLAAAVESTLQDSMPLLSHVFGTEEYKVPRSSPRAESTTHRPVKRLASPAARNALRNGARSVSIEAYPADQNGHPRRIQEQNRNESNGFDNLERTETHVDRSHTQPPLRQHYSARLPVRSLSRRSPPSSARFSPSSARFSPASSSPQRVGADRNSQQGPTRLAARVLPQPLFSHTDGEFRAPQLSFASSIPRPLLNTTDVESRSPLLSYASSFAKPSLSITEGDSRTSQLSFVSSFTQPILSQLSLMSSIAQQLPLLSSTDGESRNVLPFMSSIPTQIQVGNPAPVSLTTSVPPVCTSLRSSWRFGGELHESGRSRSVRLPVHSQ